MKRTKKLSNSEKEIMDAVWNCKTAVCVNDVFELLGNSDWKYTTVATFLTRLEKKGFVKCKKNGNQNYYKPSVSRDEYLLSQTDEFINDMYGGSAQSLIAGLCKNHISEEDFNELMNVLSKYEQN